MKYVQIFVVLVILSQMNAFHMPAKLCAPLKNIGLKVASGVIDCAGKSPMARKAMRAAVKAGKKKFHQRRKWPKRWLWLLLARLDAKEDCSELRNSFIMPLLILRRSAPQLLQKLKTWLVRNSLECAQKLVMLVLPRLSQS